MQSLSFGEIKSILDESSIGKSYEVKGWVHKIRLSKSVAFITITDGSGYFLQCVGLTVDKCTRGASLIITGEIVKSIGKQQVVEMAIKTIKIVGECDVSKYPLASTEVSLESLRSQLHLRVRDERIASIMRNRSRLEFATHAFFQQNGYYCVHTPLITTSDCEGAGEMFRVTTLPMEEKDITKDFFKKTAYLTVSGQLNGEMYAQGLGRIYTFGPTFRAEDSHTSRHLAEFWMIEPEVAFCDLQEIMSIAEKYVCYCIHYVLDHVSPERKKYLESIISQKFARCTYTDAITALQHSNIVFENDKKVVVNVTWGIDLTTPMERWLAETYFKRPVMLYNYPKEIKSFYMRDNDDGKTVANFDMLVPGVGELIGGSQREERLDVLTTKMQNLKMDLSLYKEYLALREFGTVMHSGFGLGFERLVMLCTGTEHIRDTIPFPRYPGHASC